MRPITRRAYMAGSLSAAALSALPGGLRAAAVQAPVPPEGIGRRIRHVSYSDQGGRPDGVQIMLNRNHLYVGHQFTDGFTVIDATDARNLKPVNYILTGANTSTHHLQVAEDTLLVANG